MAFSSTSSYVGAIHRVKSAPLDALGVNKANSKFDRRYRTLARILVICIDARRHWGIKRVKIELTAH